jgi:hypothetical protein
MCSSRAGWALYGANRAFPSKDFAAVIGVPVRTPFSEGFDGSTMMRHLFTVPCVLALLVGCGSESGARSAEEVPGPSDTGFSAIQERGRIAMGMDQYTSTHRFDVLADGGRMGLQRDVDDPAGVATIR